MKLTFPSFTVELSGTYAEVRFTAKPSTEVRDAMKRRRFRWSPQSAIWYGNLTGAAEFFQCINEMINPTAAKEARKLPCWTCNSPDGLMRNYGPATPVYCDSCHAIHHKTNYPHLYPKEREPIDRFDLMVEDSYAAACGLN